MKINEFIEKYKKQNLTQSTKSLLTVKNYLPYMNKQDLVNNILSKCKVTNYDYIQIDEMKKYIVFTVEIIKTYTNLEFDDDFNNAISEYDALCEAGVLNNIIETFEGEYKTVLNMVTMRQDYILQSNSVESQVARFLNGINNRLDDVMELLSGQFGSFKDLNISSEDIDKLTQVIASLGK